MMATVSYWQAEASGESSAEPSPSPLPARCGMAEVGHGMGCGFRMGRLTASLLLGRSDPFDDLFHAHRFEREAQG